ncbi:MAG TPA: outer membrane lipoprotein carrier protein LolA [Terriglobia bacterium]|nr:outer membrane lipoprotein carrier protein LolA [Terriglobia bacterium]
MSALPRTRATERACHRAFLVRKWPAACEVLASAAILFVTLSFNPAIVARPGQEPPSVEDFVSRLESSYHTVKALRAEFVQTYVANGQTRVESGTVMFARGGRMRWDYRQPEEKLFLSDGKYLVLYVPAEKQLTRSRVKESDDVRVPFRLLLSRLNLRRVFGRFEFADQALRPEPGDRVLRALPKHEDESGYHEVLMEITPEFDIRRLVIHFTDHSSMEFTFKGIDRNVQTNSGLFNFTPPPGTEVIDAPNE